MSAKTPPEQKTAPVTTEVSMTAPGETLETVLKAARIASPVITAADGQEYAFVPLGFTLQELEDVTRLPPRPNERLTVDDRASLTAYANRFSGSQSVIIADYDKSTIGVRLDWHPHNQMEEFSRSGSDTHSVTLKLRLSEEFQRWNAIAGKLQAQADFALFLEENSGDVLHPDAATMIEISKDFEATVGQTYKSAIRLDNGDRRLVFQSETNATNGLVIPQKLTLNIPIYNGEKPEELVALFRWRPDANGGVMLGFQWHRIEYMRRARFNQIAYDTAEDTGLPVFAGRQGHPS